MNLSGQLAPDHKYVAIALDVFFPLDRGHIDYHIKHKL